MAAIASPPAGPQPGPTAVPVNMPAPPSAPSTPAPSTSTPPATDHGPAPTPNKGLDDMFDRIGEKYGQDSTDAAKPGQKKVAPKPEAKPEEKQESVITEEAKVEPEKSATEKTSEKPAEAKTETKKVNPWKLVDEHKAARAKSESEVAELRKLIPNEAARKAEIEKATKLEAQNKELLEHIRYLDYQKHPEFQEKYQKPWDEQWDSIAKRLQRVTVLEDDGVTRRAVTTDDLEEIQRLPLDQAYELAEKKFGKAGTWVAERLEDLRGLEEKRFLAIQKAKKEGAEFFSKQQESESIHEKQRNDFLATTYEKSLQDLDTHSVYGAYFKAKEGDDEWNSKIDKGNSFVKKAWEQSPLEKGISAEEQANRVKRQAKLQRFAASFSVQQLEISRLKTERDSLLQKLAQYQASTPDTDGGQIESNGAPQAGYTIDSFEDALSKRAVSGPA